METAILLDHQKISTRGRKWPAFDSIRLCPLFSGLSFKNVENLAAHARRINVTRGQTIYGEDEPGRSVYLIVDGAVKLVSSSPNGKEIVLAYLGETELFGETAVADRSPREHRAVAAEDTTIIAIDIRRLERLMTIEPALGLRVTKFIGRRLRSFQMRFLVLMFRNTRQRLAMLLLELSEKFGVQDPQNNEIAINLRITHSEMAGLIGVTRESVTFALHDLEFDSMIRTVKRRIFLTDLDRLGELGGLINSG